MSYNRRKLRSFDLIAPDVQSNWAKVLLAEFLKVTKKDLRKARMIMRMYELLDPKIVDKNGVICLFRFGYRSFYVQIKKKLRHILAPHPKLQKIFKAVNKRIVELYPPHEKAYGFVKKRNVKMATESLVGNKHFFSFDISDAFPSITDQMVEKILFDLGAPEDLVVPLARLVTYQYEGLRRLPQGASSSPAVLNMVYKPICEELEELCQSFGIDWCVYADDFTFAGEEITPEMQETLLAVPKRYGFKIKPEKTKNNFGNTVPRMLGLTIVDGKVHLKRRTKRRFRRIFYLAWKYGAYNNRQVTGVASNIRQVYGEPENWPGSLRKYWVAYMNKKLKEERS